MKNHWEYAPLILVSVVVILLTGCEQSNNDQKLQPTVPTAAQATPAPVPAATPTPATGAPPAVTCDIKAVRATPINFQDNSPGQTFPATAQVRISNEQDCGVHSTSWNASVTPQGFFAESSRSGDVLSVAIPCGVRAQIDVNNSPYTPPGAQYSPGYFVKAWMGNGPACASAPNPPTPTPTPTPTPNPSPNPTPPPLTAECHTLAVCDVQPDEVEIKCQNTSASTLQITGQLFAQQDSGGGAQLISEVPPQYQTLAPGMYGGPEERIRNRFSPYYFNGVVYGWAEVRTSGGQLVKRQELQQTHLTCGTPPPPPVCDCAALAGALNVSSPVQSTVGPMKMDVTMSGTWGSCGPARENFHIGFDNNRDAFGVRQLTRGESFTWTFDQQHDADMNVRIELELGSSCSVVKHVVIPKCF